MSELSQDLPTLEQIGLRAYELFLARGCEHGRDLEDWFTAEKELQAETQRLSRAELESRTGRKSKAVGRAVV